MSAVTFSSQWLKAIGHTLCMYTHREQSHQSGKTVKTNQRNTGIPWVFIFFCQILTWSRFTQSWILSVISCVPLMNLCILYMHIHAQVDYKYARGCVFSCVWRPGRSICPHRCCLALYTWSEWRGEGEEEEGATRVGRVARAKWMRCKWHQRTWESIYLIETNESSSALAIACLLFFFLAAPIVIVINSPNPNLRPSLSQTYPTPP